MGCRAWRTAPTTASPRTGVRPALLAVLTRRRSIAVAARRDRNDAARTVSGEGVLREHEVHQSDLTTASSPLRDKNGHSSAPAIAQGSPERRAISVQERRLCRTVALRSRLRPPRSRGCPSRAQLASVPGVRGALRGPLAARAARQGCARRAPEAGRRRGSATACGLPRNSLRQNDVHTADWHAAGAGAGYHPAR